MRCACAHTLVTCAECGGKITVLRKAPPKPGRTRKQDRAERRRRHAEETAEIRRKVFERAGTNCEARYLSGAGSRWGPFKWVRCPGKPEILDHWEGGMGRRRQQQGTDTCWALCGSCNRQRTANHPSADYWNRSREAFCSTNGLPFTPHIVRASRRGADGGERGP